jgi:hypothetical protein
VFRSHTQAASLAAATAVVLSATPAFALNSIELTDKRAENQSGLQLIYEVRHPSRSRALHPRIVTLNRIPARIFAFGESRGAGPYGQIV